MPPCDAQRWPKLFQNLHSTRETELADNFPVHVVCQWIGNSQPIAAKHYLQVGDRGPLHKSAAKSAAATRRRGSHDLAAENDQSHQTCRLQGFA